jgi:transposase
VRFIGLDVHRDFCEVAICEEGSIRSAPRVATTPEALERFAQSLGPKDEVALECTGNALTIARIIESHVGRVVIAHAKAVRAIAWANVKNDRIDARTLAMLLASGFLPGVWTPDERTRLLRRLVTRRAQLLKQRTSAKNQVHATLHRNLVGKPPATDLFGRRGRAWLERVELPADERETVDGALRQIDLLNEEIGHQDRVIAEQTVGSAEVRRLMTIPGVNVTTAVTFVAAIGDVSRFSSPRHLSSYLGLTPRSRQSGASEARHGRISKEGSARARHALVEAAWAVLKTPGPLRAFGERVAAKRGRNVAAVAVARKLAVLCWHLLVSEQDYLFGRPSLTAEKLRRLELAAGASSRRGWRGPGATFASQEQHARERTLALHAEATYRRFVADRGTGAGGITGARISALEGQAARQGQAPDPALQPEPTRTRPIVAKEPLGGQALLDFHP